MELVLTVAAIHLLACLSPGPDILLVALNSLRRGWRAGVATTFGILTGVSIQIALGISGITYLLSRSPGTQKATALAGGAWLFYLGARGLWSKWRSSPSGGSPSPGKEDLPATGDTAGSFWTQGFLVNILNPKALLYFLSLFSVLLGPQVTVSMKIICGITMVIVQALAFSSAAVLLDRLRAGRQWTRLQASLDPVMSIILLLLGLWIWARTGASLLD